jgi:Reverse transcriptase (RNA-dependent DNA polymerase)
MVHRWRRREARGEVFVVRFADDAVVGFQHRDDAERFLADLRDRFAKFNLELAEEKTRLIEFGRCAARNRNNRGLARPETFEFLGFTHACGKTGKTGRFALKRVTSKKRLRAKLRAVKTELMRRRHDPILEQGQRLGSVVRGHAAYYAVPGNIDAVAAFHNQAVRHRRRALRRRSQRTRPTRERMRLLDKRWLPTDRILHPSPNVRFDARTQGKSPVRQTRPLGSVRAAGRASNSEGPSLPQRSGRRAHSRRTTRTSVGLPCLYVRFPPGEAVVSKAFRRDERASSNSGVSNAGVQTLAFAREAGARAQRRRACVQAVERFRAAIRRDPTQSVTASCLAGSIKAPSCVVCCGCGTPGLRPVAYYLMRN